jgi:hypothetical protein
VWGVIFGHELGALPHPATLVEPAAHGFCGHCAAVFGPQRRREGGTTPPRAAPALSTWGLFEKGAQRTREPGHEEGRLDGDGELPSWIDTEAPAPGAIRTYDTGDPGARAQQERRTLRRVTARSTEQENMEREPRARPGAAEDRTPLGLLFRRHLQ